MTNVVGCLVPPQIPKNLQKTATLGTPTIMLFDIIEKVGVCAKRIWYSFWSLSHRPQKNAPYVARCILDRRIRVSRILDASC